MRHAAKDQYVRKLCCGRDVVALSETHGLEGEGGAWSCPFGFRAWFSPGTSRRAGVGLLVKQSFLAQFSANPVWDEVVPGRAGILRLRGPSGALDLVMLYFPMGSDSAVVPRGSSEEGRA